MNEQSNADLVRAMYAAFARGDVQMILDNCAEDIEWVLEGPATIPFAGKKRGRAQVQQFFEALATTQKDQKLTTELMVAQGDHVATLGRYSGSVVATGKAFEGPIGHFFTIRG